MRVCRVWLLDCWQTILRNFMNSPASFSNIPKSERVKLNFENENLPKTENDKRFMAVKIRVKGILEGLFSQTVGSKVPDPLI